jgi:hypothetical protein
MQLRGGKEAWEGQYDHAVKMWEGLGNQLRGGKEAWDWPVMTMQ